MQTISLDYTCCIREDSISFEWNQLNLPPINSEILLQLSLHNPLFDFIEYQSKFHGAFEKMILIHDENRI